MAEKKALRLITLGDSCSPVSVEASGSPADPRTQESLQTVESNLALITSTIDGEIYLLEDRDTELFATLAQARAEALAARETLGKARAATLDNFNQIMEELHDRYANLIASLKHALFIMARAHEVAMRQASEQYQGFEGRMLTNGR